MRFTTTQPVLPPKLPRPSVVVHVIRKAGTVLIVLGLSGCGSGRLSARDVEKYLNGHRSDVRPAYPPVHCERTPDSGYGKHTFYCREVNSRGQVVRFGMTVVARDHNGKVERIGLIVP